MERGPPVRGASPLESTLARLSHLVLDPRLPGDFREEVLNRVRTFYCELQDLAQQPPERGGRLREERSRPSDPGRKQEREHQKGIAEGKEHKKSKSATRKSTRTEKEEEKQDSDKEASPSITPTSHDTKGITSKVVCREKKRKEKEPVKSQTKETGRTEKLLDKKRRLKKGHQVKSQKWA